jgi:uncharacterized protein (TIGR00730 family)
MVGLSQNRVRKFLSAKISQLNDIVADLDSVVTQMGSEFYRVCIFGSARIKPDSEDYKLVYDLAYELSKREIDIVTGGGPGLMEAANMGAKAGGSHSKSIGLHIDLPSESDSNSHLDIRYQHRRFSSRLDEFMRISNAFVVTPGGIGTILELLFTWQLIQVKHIESKPLILLGKEMWQGLLKWVEEQPLKRKLLDDADLAKVVLVDTVSDVVKNLEGSISIFNQRKKTHKKESL